MKSFKVRGLWCRPGSDRKVPGILTFSPKRGLRLSIFERFAEEFPGVETYETILGVVEKSTRGSFVVLSDCLRLSSRISMPGLGSEEFVATFGFLSDRPLDVAGALAGFDDRFGRVCLRFTRLDDWVSSQNNFHWEQRGERGFSLTYEPPPAHSANIGSLANVSLRVDAEARLSMSRFGAAEHALFEARLEAPLGFQKIQQDVARPLQDLVSFATDRPSIPSRVLLWEAKTVVGATPVSAYYKPISGTAAGRGHRLSPSDMLFRLADVQADFGGFMTSWFDLHQRLAPFWGSFLGLSYAPAKYVEARFGLTMHAVLLLARAHVEIPDTADEIEAVRWLLNEVDALLPAVLSIDHAEYLRAIEVLRNRIAHGQAIDAVRTHWISEGLTWLVKAMILDRLTGSASEALLRRNAGLEYMRQQLHIALNA